MTNVNETELTIATKVAYRFGRRWKLVEEEDLAGHLTLWLFENKTWLETWRRSDYGTASLYVALKHEAAKYCASETAKKVGQPLDAGRFYSVALIRRVLPFVFESNPLPSVRQNPVTGAPLDPYAESVALDVLLDVRNAYYDLPEKTRGLIALRYRDGLSHGEIAELRNLSLEAEQTAIHRAIKRMSDYLEGKEVGPE